jgi:hypothetical protein
MDLAARQAIQYSLWNSRSTGWPDPILLSIASIFCEGLDPGLNRKKARRRPRMREPKVIILLRSIPFRNKKYPNKTMAIPATIRKEY